MSFTIEEQQRCAELNRLDDECSNFKEEFEQYLIDQKDEILHTMWLICKMEPTITYAEALTKFEEKMKGNKKLV